MKIGKYLLLVLIFLITFSQVSCRFTGRDSAKNHSSIDSLFTQAERYVMELQTDSLRDISHKCIERVQPYSRDFFKAYRLLINADFNDKNYDKVLSSIAKVSEMPHFTRYKDVECSFNYTRARAFQFQQRYEEAIATFNKCLISDAAEEDVRERIRTVVIEALLQLMNTYQAAGQSVRCVDYFRSLIETPPTLIRDFCMRDLYSIYAYALSRTDDMQLAERTIQEALRMPLFKATPERYFRDYSYAAAIFYGNAEKQKQVIEWCHKAIECAESYNYTAGVQWTTSLLGELYKKTGNVEEAIELYKSSVARSVKMKDVAGEANAYNSLTNLYLSYDFLDLANSSATNSIRKIWIGKSSNPMLVGFSYLLKSKVMLKSEDIDSAFYFLSKADSCYQNIPYTSGTVNIDLYIGEYMVENCKNDSLQEGIERLQRVITNSSTNNNLALAYLLLAKGLIRQGNNRDAEQMLENMDKVLNAGTLPIYLDDAYRFALQYYLDKKDLLRIKHYAKAYLQEANFYFNSKVSKKITELSLHYEKEKKQQEILLKERQLKNKELRIKMYLILIISLIGLLLISFVLIGYRHKLYKIKQQLQDQKLSALMQEKEMIHTRSKEMEDQLHELFTIRESSRQIAAFTPNLYRESGDSKFRQRFTQLYPSFLVSLKSRVPNISKNEEILCMLIILDQTTDQIADILCIERGSVNMARHRLRQKMQLAKGESLEMIIKDILDVKEDMELSI